METAKDDLDIPGITRAAAGFVDGDVEPGFCGVAGVEEGGRGGEGEGCWGDCGCGCEGGCPVSG